MRFRLFNSLNSFSALWFFIVIGLFPTVSVAETDLDNIDMTTTITKGDGSQQTYEGSVLNDSYSSGVTDDGEVPDMFKEHAEQEGEEEAAEPVAKAEWKDKDAKDEKEEEKDISNFTGTYNDRSIIPEKMAVYCELNVEDDIVKSESGEKISECIGKYIYEMSKANAEERKDAEKEYTDLSYKITADSLATAIAKNGSVSNFEEEMNKYGNASDKQTSSADDEVALTHEVALATDILNNLSELLTENLKTTVFRNLGTLDPSLVVREENPYKDEEEGDKKSTFSGVYNGTKIIPQEMADYCEINAQDFMEAEDLEKLYGCVKKYVADLNNGSAEHKLAAEQDFSKLRYNLMVDQIEVAINNAISLANYEETMNKHGESNMQQGTVMDNEIGLSEQLSFLTDVLNRVRKLKLAEMEQYAIEGIKNIDPSIAAQDEEKEEEKAEEKGKTEVDYRGYTSETKSVSETGELDNSEGEMK